MEATTTSTAPSPASCCTPTETRTGQDALSALLASLLVLSAMTVGLLEADLIITHTARDVEDQKKNCTFNEECNYRIIIRFEVYNTELSLSD